MERTGKFTVAESVMRSEVFPFVMAKMRFVPYRVEYIYHLNAAEYIGFSWMFEENPEYCVPREYVLAVSEVRDKDGRVIDAEVTVS